MQFLSRTVAPVCTCFFVKIHYLNKHCAESKELHNVVFNRSLETIQVKILIKNPKNSSYFKNHLFSSYIEFTMPQCIVLYV